VTFKKSCINGLTKSLAFDKVTVRQCSFSRGETDSFKCIARAYGA